MQPCLAHTIIGVLIINSFVLSTLNLPAQEMKTSSDTNASSSLTQLPAITVTAQKEPEPAQTAPVSVTAVAATPSKLKTSTS